MTRSAKIASGSALAAELSAFFVAKDYAGMKLRVSAAKTEDLAAAWPALDPMPKAVCFKLIEEPRRAMDLYKALPFAEKYFLLGAFDMESVAPVLEDAAPKVRALFRRLPADAYDRMIHFCGEGLSS